MEQKPKIEHLYTKESENELGLGLIAEKAIQVQKNRPFSKEVEQSLRDKKILLNKPLEKIRKLIIKNSENLDFNQHIKRVDRLYEILAEIQEIHNLLADKINISDITQAFQYRDEQKSLMKRLNDLNTEFEIIGNEIDKDLYKIKPEARKILNRRIHDLTLDNKEDNEKFEFYKELFKDNKMNNLN